MSSFIVEEQTINRIVNFCFWEHDAFLKYEIEKELKKVGLSLHEHTEDEDLNKELKQFGEELLKMNLMAFYSRYKHNEEIIKEIKTAIKEYSFKDTTLNERQDLQVLKSIHCYLYQCMEGEIEQTILYKVIKNIGLRLSEHIINKLPEYENAIWN